MVGMRADHSGLGGAAADSGVCGGVCDGPAFGVGGAVFAAGRRGFEYCGRGIEAAGSSCAGSTRVAGVA